MDGEASANAGRGEQVRERKSVGYRAAAQEVLMTAARMFPSLVLFIGVMVAPVGAQIYPNKPIRIIIPFPPGGAPTIIARLMGDKLTQSWGQPVIVDNRGGGNTVIGSEALVKSPPDGSTLGLMTSAHVIYPLLIPNLPYDSIKDFTPIATLARAELILAVHPSVPVNSLQELVAYAKTRPGQLNYASVGSGGMTHLATESFSTLAGVKMQQVPYKGTAPAFTDLVGGQVHLFFSPPTAALVPFIKSGKLKAIAVSGESRKAALPQVPTLTEGGLPGFDIKVWYGILAPLHVPRRIIDTIAAKVPKILASADMKERLVNQELDPFISTPEQFAALIRDDTARFARIIKEGNIKLEN